MLPGDSGCRVLAHPVGPPLAPMSGCSAGVEHRPHGSVHVSIFWFRRVVWLAGWLAWTVVLCHIAFFTGLMQRYPILKPLQPAGDLAVSIFIILSGFVITHLVLAKAEPYGMYIKRRFLRIFPIYGVALALGFVTTFLNFHTFLDTPPADVFPMTEVGRLAVQRHALDGNGLWINLGLHLLMLHGAVSSNVVFESMYAFLRPAWSLSLEWQFYLLAPFLIWAAVRKWPSVILAFVAVAGYTAFALGYLGNFVLPSFLPGAGLLFAVGIASCLIVGDKKTHASRIALVVIAAACLYWYAHDHTVRLALFIWIMFLTASVLRGRPDSLGRSIAAIYDPLFSARWITSIGLASYSTYLLHVPILQLMQWLTVRQLGLGAVGANALAVVGTLALTFLLSKITFRWIETPCINIGKGQYAGTVSTPIEVPAIEAVTLSASQSH